MRLPLALSLALHTAVAAVGVVALPQFAIEPADLPPVLPVELLTVADETNIIPATDEPLEEETAPEPTVVRPRPAPPPPPQPAPPRQSAPERMAEAAPPPPARPEPAPRPPDPDRVPVEPVPEPPAASTEDLARARPAAKPAPPAPRSVPETAPTAPEPDLFSELTALVDKKPREDTGRDVNARLAARDVQTTDGKPRAAAGLQTELTMSEIDTIKAQLKPCWTPPTGAPNAESLIVTLRVQLDISGHLAAMPEVVGGIGGTSFMRVAADRAISAVLQCTPFSLPPSRYQAWRVMDLEFDPRFLLGE